MALSSQQALRALVLALPANSGPRLRRATWACARSTSAAIGIGIDGDQQVVPSLGTTVATSAPSTC
jgi:hypothetical protein